MKNYKTFEEQVRALVQHQELISISVLSSNPFQEVADEFALRRRQDGCDSYSRMRDEGWSEIGWKVVGAEESYSF